MCRGGKDSQRGVKCGRGKRGKAEWSQKKVSGGGRQPSGKKKAGFKEVRPTLSQGELGAKKPKERFRKEL